MTEELTTQTPREIAPADPFLTMLAAAAKDPGVDVAKMRELLAFKREVEADQAKREFFEAVAAASIEMPRILKDKKRDNNITFASYENIDDVIRPILSRHGLCQSFRSKKTDKGAWIELVVTHRGGHSETSEVELPPDTGGAKNAIQANGSAHKYARRYLVLAYWNIVTEGMDDDGASACPITDDQRQTLMVLMKACKLDDDGREAFLKFMNADAVMNIQRKDFKRAIVALNRKLEQIQKAEAAQ